MVSIGRLHDIQIMATLGHQKKENVLLIEAGHPPTPAQYCKKAQWGYEIGKEFLPEDTLPKTIEVLPAQVAGFVDLLEEMDGLPPEFIEEL